MSEITITKENFENEVLKSDKTVLLDFWAAWCGPCSALSPLVHQFAQEHSEIKVGKINIDEQNELAGQFGIMSIPTLAVMKDGKVVNSSIGLISKEQIEELVKIV